MKKLCIPRDKAKQLIKAIKKIGFDDFSEMTDVQRKKLFSEYAGKELAEKLEKGFKDALDKDDFRAVVDWAKKNLKPEDAKEIAKLPKEDLVESIRNGNLSEDLFRKKIGADLTTKEIKKFAKLGKEVFDLQEKLSKSGVTEIGNVLDDATYDMQVEYFKKIQELEEFAQSLSPHNGIWDIYTKNIWKAGALATLKSTGLNIWGNTTVMVGERVVDRVVNKTFGTHLMKEKKMYIKRAMKLYNAAGFDLSRSTGLTAKDAVIGSGRYAGEGLSTPKSNFMKRFSEFVFGKMLGKPDVAAGLVHRADSTGVIAQAMAKKGNIPGFEGLSGKQLEEALFRDSIRMNPTTEAGEFVRDVSIHNARVGTYTADTKLTKAATDLKNVLNDAGNLGEILMPFVKTPTNVIGLSLEYAGAGMPLALAKNVRSLLSKNYVMTKAEMRRNTESLVRGGIGLSSAAVIASMVDMDDYIGSYDPAETKSRNIKGATSDSVKIQDRYWSLDYFGVLRTPVKFELERKKATHFYQALISTVASEAGNLPIFGATGVTSFLEAASGDEGDINKMIDKIPGKILGHTYGSIPFAAQVGDIAKSSDKVQRDTGTNEYSLIGLSFDKVVSKIPYLRETLPEKVSVFGDTLQTNGALNILTGARSAKAVETPAVKEFRRLEDEGLAPNIPDIAYTNSEKIARIEEQIGKRGIIEEKKKMGEKISKIISKLVQTDKYKKLANEDKKDLQERIAKNERNRFMSEYGEAKFKELDLRSLFEQYVLNDEKTEELIEDIRENTSYKNEKYSDNEDYLIGRIITYAKAIKTDPVTAFNRYATGQRIRRIDSGAIIVERMETGGSKGSQGVRAELGYEGDVSVKLDHTIPLQLGGSNSRKNLKIVSTREWSAYTKKENELGRKLRDRKITKAQAQKEIVAFKSGWKDSEAGQKSAKIPSLAKIKENKIYSGRYEDKIAQVVEGFKAMSKKERETELAGYSKKNRKKYELILEKEGIGPKKEPVTMAMIKKITSTDKYKGLSNEKKKEVLQELKNRMNQ